VLQTGQPLLNQEVVGETADDPGRLHVWCMSYYPVTANGVRTGICVLAIDITDRKQTGGKSSGESTLADVQHPAQRADDCRQEVTETATRITTPTRAPREAIVTTPSHPAST
jgi:hypothetical protein